MMVQQSLEEFREEIVARGLLDEVTAAEGLRRITTGTLNDLESVIKNVGNVTLKRPQILHALQTALRTVCVEALAAGEARKQESASSDLLAQKAAVEEHFLLIVQANKGDVERATNFAALYQRSLTSWMDHEVTQLAADVRNQVLQEMPDPQKSSDRAFQMSFVARKWPDVLEYVLDTSSYLEKMFLTAFHKRKRSFVGPVKARLEKKVHAANCLLRDVVGQWARRAMADADTGTSEKTQTAAASALNAARTSRRSIRELKDFIVAHAQRVPASSEAAELHRRLAECLPETADFSIADPKIFANTVHARISDVIDSPQIHDHLGDRLNQALREQSVQAWSLIHGCSERCPLCGSKCDLVGEHANHRCEHHLFPAFQGWMDVTGDVPSFNHCMGCATREGTYECSDGKLRKFEEYLRVDHPSWLSFLCEDGQVRSAERDAHHLRAAWVNCREPLLEYFAPMKDDCPQHWVEEHLDEGRSLCRDDLEVAKNTIRKLRNHTWVPEDD